jgi:hypothetical protein
MRLRWTTAYLPWTLEATQSARCEIPTSNQPSGNRIRVRRPATGSSPRGCSRTWGHGAQIGIKQKVYLPVQRELSYRVSFYARHLSGPAGIAVLLRDRETGKTLAESSVEAPAAEWTKYQATLQLAPGAVRRLQAVDFGMAVEGSERVDIDEISLMPADAIGILDPDEVAMAKAMHVTELRLGGNFSSSYHWRDGVGPADKRPTMEKHRVGHSRIQPLRHRRVSRALRFNWSHAANRSEYGKRHAGGDCRLGSLHPRAPQGQGVFRTGQRTLGQVAGGLQNIGSDCSGHARFQQGRA